MNPDTAPRTAPLTRAARRAIAALLLLLPLCAWAKDPQVIYMMECQGCHLADGGGGLNNIPALNNHVAKFLAVPGGREYLVQVPGVALSSLSDQEVTSVLNWMLTRFGPAAWASQSLPYSVTEVADLRKKPLTEIARKRADLVSLIRQREAKPIVVR